MNTFDVIYLIITAYFLFKGIYKGFIAELFSILALVFGFTAAYFFYPVFAAFFTSILPNITLAQPIMFVIIFVVVAIVTVLVGKLATKFTKLVALGFLNRVAGGIFGLIKAYVLFFAFWFAFDLLQKNTDVSEPTWLSTSVLYKTLATVAEQTATIIL